MKRALPMSPFLGPATHTIELLCPRSKTLAPLGTCQIGSMFDSQVALFQRTSGVLAGKRDVLSESMKDTKPRKSLRSPERVKGYRTSIPRSATGACTMFWMCSSAFRPFGT